MAKRAKKPTHKTTSTLIADGISQAFSEIEELGSSMREWFDNCNENLQQSDKMQTVEQTADTLEGLSEPDLPDWLTPEQSDEGPRFDHVEANITPLAYSRRSRATRCSDTASLLQNIVDRLNEIEEEEEAKKEKDKNQDKIDEIGSLRDELENAISELEGCEFPGMYG